MTIDEVTNYFTSMHRATLALGIAASNITQWRSKGYIPLKQQFRLAMITNGELLPDDNDPALLVKENKIDSTGNEFKQI